MNSSTVNSRTGAPRGVRVPYLIHTLWPLGLGCFLLHRAWNHHPLLGGLLPGRGPVSVVFVILTIWTGIAAVIVGLAYGGRTLDFPVERILVDSSGRPRLLAWLASPFGLIAGFVIRLGRIVKPEPFADEVAPGLLVGGVPLVGDRQRVAALSVGAVVNMCVEFGDRLGLAGKGCAYLREPLLDGTAPFPESLDRTVAWVMARRDPSLVEETSGRVLIHCAQGHGRSAAVAACVLLATGEAQTVDEAIERMRASRPGIRLGRAQRAAVEMFHKRNGAS